MTQKNPSFRRRKASKSIDLQQLPPVQGFALDKNLSVRQLLGHYSSLGFQASNLGRAVELVQRMKKDQAAVFLSLTSNMVSSGLREIIAQLVRHKLVAAIVTSTGAIEEDCIKSRHPFRVGDFEVNDSEVKANKLNRIGNLFVPDDHYVDFEAFHTKFIEKRYAQKRIWAPSDYVFELGKEIQDKHSVLHWATQNRIPIYCPGFVDGAMGDHFYFFNQGKREKLVIDQAADVTKFYDQILQPDKVGGVILGGGIAKHHLIGAAILRDGLDYAVYVSTGTQYDGSLSGALPKEAVSWNKLKDQRNAVAIEAEATLVFPLLAWAWVNL
ncbi:MAG: deoxyhypusine synthase [Candidatus Diapherotrites archaeon]|uniref:Deoxyhypusine synthase n=1 Tax=Candidatus Iainarchaeum sp. TaxID=3101447 RepID=A0A8T4L6S1_9ARCH|nr:deoxyhypusine synthase [Candidatus Diapherotrites archaeon]